MESLLATYQTETHAVSYGLPRLLEPQHPKTKAPVLKLLHETKTLSRYSVSVLYIGWLYLHIVYMRIIF